MLIEPVAKEATTHTGHTERVGFQSRKNAHAHAYGDTRHRRELTHRDRHTGTTTKGHTHTHTHTHTHRGGGCGGDLDTDFFLPLLLRFGQILIKYTPMEDKVVDTDLEEEACRCSGKDCWPSLVRRLREQRGLWKVPLEEPQQHEHVTH